VCSRPRSCEVSIHGESVHITGTFVSPAAVAAFVFSRFCPGWSLTLTSRNRGLHPLLDGTSPRQAWRGVLVLGVGEFRCSCQYHARVSRLSVHVLHEKGVGGWKKGGERRKGWGTLVVPIPPPQKIKFWSRTEGRASHTHCMHR
jgi:hypothetical protein